MNKEKFMLRTIASIFGAIMVIVGILGFFPMFAPGGHLLGIFHVDTLHNIIHIVTGVVALACGLCKRCNMCCGNGEKKNRPVNREECPHAARTFFQVFGIVYGIVALLGFYYGNAPILGILANNIADAWLHTVIALFSLYLGFIYKENY